MKENGCWWIWMTQLCITEKTKLINVTSTLFSFFFLSCSSFSFSLSSIRERERGSFCSEGERSSRKEKVMRTWNNFHQKLFLDPKMEEQKYLIHTLNLEHALEPFLINSPHSPTFFLYSFLSLSLPLLTLKSTHSLFLFLSLSRIKWRNIIFVPWSHFFSTHSLASPFFFLPFSLSFSFLLSSWSPSSFLCHHNIFMDTWLWLR